MTVKSKKFTKGIKTKPTTSPATEEGEQRTDSSSNEQKIYLDGAERTVVTEDQAQTLSNKAIDSANNAITVDADEATVENLETDNLKAGVLETDLNNAVTDANLPSAAAVKTYVSQELATQDEASEIAYDDTGNDKVTGANVQAALDAAETSIDTNETNISTNSTNLSNHLTDTTDAHDASAISNSPSGNLSATDVQSALNELQTDIDTRASDADLNNHITDTTDAHDSSAISYDNTTSGLTSTDAQAAIDEVEGRVDTNETNITNNANNLTNHLNDTTDAHDASAISNAPSGNLAATDVQSALNELQTDVDTRALDSDLTNHINDTSTHGVTGNIVGTIDAQTLTNKTITGADFRTPDRSDVKQDTRANLDVYATTAADGQTVFATDEKKYYGIVDNALVSLGGGLGSAQTVGIVEADDLQNASDFSGNNASFLGGGTLDAGSTLELSTTAADLLTGEDAVIKYTSGASSQNDYWGNDFAVPQGWGGRTLAVELTYRTNATYNSGDILVSLASNNGTTDTLLPTFTLDQFTNANGNGETKRFLVNVPSDIETLKVGYQNVSTTSGLEFFVDKISVDINDFNYKNVQTDSGYHINQLGTAMTDVAGEVRFDLGTADIADNTDDILVEDDSGSNRTKFTMLADGTVTVTFNFKKQNTTTSTRPIINHYSSSGTLIKAYKGQGNVISGTTVTNTSSIIVKATEFITLEANGDDVSTSAGVETFANFSFSKLSKHVVTENETSENVFSATCDGAAGASVTFFNENTSWIDSVSQVSTGIFDITVKSGIFTVPPNVTVSATDITSNAGAFVRSVTASVITIQTTREDTGGVADRDFHLIVQRQGDDYKDPSSYHLVPVTEQENTFSAAIANNGTASITLQSGSNGSGQNAIASVNRSALGVVDITFTAGFFTEIPVVIASTDNANTSVNNIIDVCAVTTSGCSIVTNDYASANIDIDFQLSIFKQGADYKEPKAFIGNVPLNYTQTKILSADVTTDTEMTDLTFNNLVVGRAYRITGSILLVTSSGGVNNGNQQVNIQNGATLIGNVGQNLVSSTTDTRISHALSIDFIAVDTTVTFNSASTTATSFVRGDGTRAESYATLTELNHTQETTRF